MTRAPTLAAIAVLAGASVASAAPTPPSIDLASVAPPTPNGKPWPLVELPSLQPHLDLAMAKDACTDAARKRARDDDVRAYLAAWCRIRAGNRDAMDELAPLARKGRGDVARAARLDLVNLLADYASAQSALDRLRRLKLDTSEMLDLLAATYRALDMRADAFVVGFQAARVDAFPPVEATCERVLAWSSLDDTDLTVALDSLAGHPSQGDCVKRARAMQCALVRGHRTNFGFGARLVAIRECFAELPDDPDRDAKLATLVVFTGWIEHDADGWIAVAREAETALPVHGAEALAVAALENALHGRACGKRTVAAVSAAATRLAAHDRHESSLDPRLTALRAMSCSK